MKFPFWVHFLFESFLLQNFRVQPQQMLVSENDSWHHISRIEDLNEERSPTTTGVDLEKYP